MSKALKKYEAALDQIIKEIKSHMRTEGWDLRADFYTDDIFYKVHGTHLSTMLLRKVQETPGIALKYDNSKPYRGFVITKLKKNQKSKKKRKV